MTARNFTTITPCKAKWELIYKVVTASGKSHNPRSFAIDVLHNIGKICPFDAGLAYFLDKNGKIIGMEVVHANTYWRQVYQDYYGFVENRPFQYFVDIPEDPVIPTINVRDWEKEWSEQSIHFFVQPIGLKYSCGFALYDLNGKYKTIFSLDRHTKSPFSNDDLYNLQLAVCQLNELHKNFYYRKSHLDAMEQEFWTDAHLTAREIEVVDLLIQGFSPQEISAVLYISMSTTYKHITHIYNKMKVTNRQELMVKLFSGKKDIYREEK